MNGPMENTKKQERRRIFCRCGNSNTNRGINWGIAIGVPLGFLIGLLFDEKLNGMIIGFSVGMGIGGIVDWVTGKRRYSRTKAGQ